MTAAVPSFYIFLVTVTIARSLDNASTYEVEGVISLKEICDEVEYRKDNSLSLNENVYLHAHPEKCYPEIGCFSPSTGIVRFIGTLYPYSPEYIETKFRLYSNRLNPEAFIELDYIEKDTLFASEFNPEVPIVVLVHGYLGNGMNEWIMTMKNELLKNQDVNVIAVDFRKGMTSLYRQAVVNAELIGRQIARLLVLLKEIRGYDIKKTHMIGYSLGAQLAGFTGKYIQKIGQGKIGRISGLEAAAPLFENKDETVRLSHHDAYFVDAIHTSLGADNPLFGNLGIIQPYGHIDFYPNGGRNQPGCLFLALICSHGRSIHLFIESINSKCQFTSYACTGGYEEFDTGKCSDKETARLGYYSNVGNTTGVFYLHTNTLSPYCIENN